MCHGPSPVLQRINYAKSKSDVISKSDGSYTKRPKRPLPPKRTAPGSVGGAPPKRPATEEAVMGGVVGAGAVVEGGVMPMETAYGGVAPLAVDGAFGAPPTVPVPVPAGVRNIFHCLLGPPVFLRLCRSVTFAVFGAI
jgi:hypothetical protein